MTISGIVKGVALYRRAFWVFLLICMVLVAAGGTYACIDAYREIRKIKGGSVWHIPSRIYSRPLYLTQGVDIGHLGLPGRLSRLRYRQVSKASRPGDYSRDLNGMTIYVHPFSYMGEQHKAIKVRVRLDGSKITGIVKPGKGTPIKSVLIEPECIAEIYDDLYEDRTIVSLKDCPKHLIDAVLTTEDRRFYSHFGISPRALVRAMISNIRHGSIQEGGSTITQQLVKNLFLTHKRTYSRKLKDMAMAVVMERMYTKDAILSMYFNEIYMGSYNHSGVCGFGRASKMLFDKNVSEVNLQEAALLAAMIKAPNAYSPYTYPKKALARRNMVLKLMFDQGKITEKEYLKAKKSSLRVVPLVPKKRRAQYFVDYVLGIIKDQFPQKYLEKGGYQIYTTLDMHMQITAEGILSRSLAGQDRRVDGAALIMDPKTGVILAMVGGKGYAGSQFNRATQIQRHIGSLIKPMVYYTALMNGFTLTTFLEDSPISVRLDDGTFWNPQNFDKISHGNVMLKDALANSYNLATVRLGMQVGVSNVALELGRVLPFTAARSNPSLLLGALECSPLEVSALYSAFAAGGNQVTPSAVRAVYDEEENLLQEYPQTSPIPALNPTVVYLVNAALKEVVTTGTARGSSAYGMPPGVCGKTGTTDDARDSWFVGFTPQMVVTVWLGADKYRSIGLSGAAGAMPIAATILSRLSPPVYWPVPGNIVVKSIDPANGKLANFWTTGGLNVPYIMSTEPTEISDTPPRMPTVEDIPRAWDYLKSFLFKPPK